MYTPALALALVTRPVLTRRAARILAGVAALSSAIACNDPTSVVDEHAEEVEGIRLTVTQGALTRTVTYRVGATKPTLELPVGTSTLAAEFLDADDHVIDDLDPEEHELELEEIDPSSAFTFARTDSFAGTITAPAATTARVSFCVTHEGHCDLEFTNVAVTIQ